MDVKMMDVKTATAIAANAHRRSVKVTVVSFVFCMVALVVSAIVMTLQFEWSAMMWTMVTLGAAIIGILMSSLFFPYLKGVRAQEPA